MVEGAKRIPPEARWNVRLTEEDVRGARKLRESNPKTWTYQALAELYGCGTVTMYKAILGITWSHVT